MRSGLAVAAAVLAVTGCSSNAPAPEAEPSEGPQATAPSEALATFPSVRSRTDARTILGPDGDLELLAGKVEGDLGRLLSFHVEEELDAPQGVVNLSYDVADGRCSGEAEVVGVRLLILTTKDGRTLGSRADQPGQWTEAASTGSGLDYCWEGLWGVTLAMSAGRMWPFTEPTRIGVEQVAGRRAVHFHKAEGPTSIDFWIAADGGTTRLLKVVDSREGGQVRRVASFSDFDSAGPIAPEPPADQVSQGGATDA